MEKSQSLLFERKSDAGLFISLALPAVVLMVIMTVYNMTDIYFIGKLGDVSALALNVLRIGLLTAPFISLYYLISSFLQASGQAGKALAVSILRQGAVLIPTLIILGSCFELTGIFWSSFTSDLISTVASAGILLAGKRRAAVKATA